MNISSRYVVKHNSSVSRSMRDFESCRLVRGCFALQLIFFFFFFLKITLGASKIVPCSNPTTIISGKMSKLQG